MPFASGDLVKKQVQAFRRASRSSAKQLARLRVLIVDGHEPSRKIAKLLLTSSGHACLAVGRASEAVEAVATFCPDAVLLDPHMRDGIGLAHRLRIASERRTLYVIATSALDEPPGFRVQEALDAYCTKPLALREINAALVAHFRRTRR